MLAERNLCCGCSACAASCPKQCITMKPDTKGFLYPYVDETKCVLCGICEKICPAINPIKYNESQVFKTFAIQNNDKETLLSSTSGGVFSALANYIISQRGIVFGGVIDNELNVYHIAADDAESIKKFRGSKYVQSEIRNTYKEAKQYLECGRLVLFSGTPCQIAGLKSFLRRDYNNLYTVDVVCHAVPSPFLFKKYVDYKSKFYKQISNFRFRSKEKGYDYSTLAFDYIDDCGKKAVYRRGSESDEWMRLFLGNDSSRDSCTKCKYQTRKAFSDLTIADLFNPQQYSEKLNSPLGYTRTYINSCKGELLVSAISSDCFLLEINMPRRDRGLATRSKKNLQKYWIDATELDDNSFFSKYYPYGLKERFLCIARNLLYSIGIYSFVKKILSNKRRK